MPGPYPDTPSADPIRGISRPSEFHNRAFAALNLQEPAQPQQPLLP